MSTHTPTLSETADRELVFTRVLDAPRELVFSAFTDAANIGRWWGPNGFRTTTHEMDVRPGGIWRFTMHGPDGTDYPNRVEYLEVVRPERLIYKHGSDQHDPERFQGFITLEEEDGHPGDPAPAAAGCGGEGPGGGVRRGGGRTPDAGAPRGVHRDVLRQDRLEAREGAREPPAPPATRCDRGAIYGLPPSRMPRGLTEVLRGSA